ncbi:MAG: glycolate oxidase subunit GlcE [Pseudomonadota bacterium]|nr:glycolate oxidase subunit GlcE [Pseudomonadota bacterium]
MADSVSDFKGDLTQTLQARVRQAFEAGEPLAIKGGGSKHFYGREGIGSPLQLTGHTGVVSYDPAELVITARAGTTLAELETTLADKGQMLGFEPPCFGTAATLGGAVASGLSGPRRPYSGAVRDFMLGVRIINGKGEALRFGGQVMKNVAGFDVSRLMAGAMGTLGVLLEVSLRVVPLPESEQTLVFEIADTDSTVRQMNQWAAQPLPLSAALWEEGGLLRARLSGSDAALAAARDRMGGDSDAEGGAIWPALREHAMPFFALDPDDVLWRLSVPPASPALQLPGRWLVDWGGAQRWLISNAPAGAVREAAEGVGGHAMRFRGGDRGSAVFQPLPGYLGGLHERLKRAFDPAGILNPGRLYEGT